MRKIKIIFILICSILLAIGLSGCEYIVDEKTEVATVEPLEANEVYIYYVNKETTKFEISTLELSNIEDIEKSLSEILDKVTVSDDKNGYKTGVTNNFIYKGFEYKDGIVTINFDLADSSWTIEEALFAKACVVKSVTQLEGVKRVRVAINDLLSKEDNTISVEVYNADSFVVAYTDDSVYTQSGSITIFFADEEGGILKEYIKKVEITSNISLEQIIMDALITGPLREGYTPTIPEGVQVNKISVKDGVCYVDLNDSFNGTLDDIRSDLTVYSVVNSLVQLPTISKVQFFINGEKQEYYRETMTFDGLFEFNDSILKQEEATTTEEVPEEAE